MSNRPNNAAHQKTSTVEVYDADALLDELRENGKPFRLGDEEFILPEPTTWPDEALAAASRDDVVGAGREILGADNYERFSKAGGNAVFLQRLVEKLHGGTLGESSGSSTS